jgi:exopolysaccharide biosynthesis polyprenyl glycosylphosphotransferase
VKSIARKIAVLIGDWAGLYLSLFLLTVIRYTGSWQANWDLHLRPFSLLFPLWIIIFYGAYLYETRFFRFGVDTLRAIGTAVTIALIASITAFYIFPPGLIQPRRNMVIFAAIYGVVAVIWRLGFYKLFGRKIKTNLLFMADGAEVAELNQYFSENPQLGYINKGVLKSFDGRLEKLREKIKTDDVKLIVVGGREGEESTENLLSLLASGVTIISLEEFYERVLGRVSPGALTDLWFIKNLENINAEVYKISKRISDILIGTLGIILCAILYFPIALAIKLNSKGPVIFKQKRTGKNNKPFCMYKFRTMKAMSPDGSAEPHGPQWAKDGDARITKVGSTLRSTRLDELPQFWNILIGDMSFVGPRPERPEFVEALERQIPYYNMRHLVRPGLTGWAQINFEYGDSLEDARIKLQYEIYYAKKRSLMLDVAIIIKTVRTVLTRQGQ